MSIEPKLGNMQKRNIASPKVKNKGRNIYGRKIVFSFILFCDLRLMIFSSNKQTGGYSFEFCPVIIKEQRGAVV